jgi:hypothetical protein
VREREEWQGGADSGPRLRASYSNDWLTFNFNFSKLLESLTADLSTCILKLHTNEYSVYWASTFRRTV